MIVHEEEFLDCRIVISETVRPARGDKELHCEVVHKDAPKTRPKDRSRSGRTAFGVTGSLDDAIMLCRGKAKVLGVWLKVGKKERE